MSHIRIIKENSNTGGGAVYCLGLIGALVYFWQNADTFGQVIIGLLKAIVWPALLVYKVLENFNF